MSKSPLVLPCPLSSLWRLEYPRAASYPWSFTQFTLLTSLPSVIQHIHWWHLYPFSPWRSRTSIISPRPPKPCAIMVPQVADKINEAKSQQITFSLRLAICPAVELNQTPLHVTNVVRYLGLDLDQLLNWNLHTRLKIKDLNRQYILLKRLLHNRSQR